MSASTRPTPIRTEHRDNLVIHDYEIGAYPSKSGRGWVRSVIQFDI